MKINKYIAVLLLALFLTKFLVMDAKVLSLMVENDQVVYVNPFCKKNNLLSQGAVTQITDASTSNAIYMVLPCTTFFQFKASAWEPITYDVLPAEFSFTIPLIEGLYHDQNYPPPRVA